MAARRYALGLDFGTNSVRAVVVGLADGREAGSWVFDYPSGEAGIVLDASDPNVARQHPRDYHEGLEHVVAGALAEARGRNGDFDAAGIIGIGVDTTGSTPIPVTADGTPLALLDGFADNPDAMAWLWKDHTAHAEAGQITETARALRPQYLAKCGGTYSSEWFWAKALRLKRVAPEVFGAMHGFVEHCDYIPALLAGDTRPERIVRGVCAAGHKAMYCEEWGGWPDGEFLAALDPGLAELRGRLPEQAAPADHLAGRLCGEWAERLGLSPGIAIAVGAFDAHMGAVGAGIGPGVLVKILGTSTCDMMVMECTEDLADIPGVCGIVAGSILPGFYGIEAGQSAVGDIFLWLVNYLTPEKYGRTRDEKFSGLAAAAARLEAGAHGLLALDWNNGNRCVLVDPRLSGLLLGQTLHTQAHEIYRALIEATAFGALTIINRIAEYGVAVKEVIACGGLAAKNTLLMQIYADVLNRQMKVAPGGQTCALGAAIFGAVAAGGEDGGFAHTAEAQAAMCGACETVYTPNPANTAVYAELYVLYKQLHDSFGTDAGEGKLGHAMKELLAIRERRRVVC